eukprot:1364826-Pleurochrysis_carterae.AAC.1
MGPELKIRSTEGRRTAVVKGVLGFAAAEGAAGLLGNAVARAKTEELDGAGGVGARGPVATVNARRAGKVLETSASLLSIYERLNSATARLDFRSP